MIVDSTATYVVNVNVLGITGIKTKRWLCRDMQPTNFGAPPPGQIVAKIVYYANSKPCGESQPSCPLRKSPADIGIADDKASIQRQIAVWKDAQPSGAVTFEAKADQVFEMLLFLSDGKVATPIAGTKLSVGARVSSTLRDLPLHTVESDFSPLLNCTPAKKSSVTFIGRQMKEIQSIYSVDAESSVLRALVTVQRKMEPWNVHNANRGHVDLNKLRESRSLISQQTEPDIGSHASIVLPSDETTVMTEEKPPPRRKRRLLRIRSRSAAQDENSSDLSELSSRMRSGRVSMNSSSCRSIANGGNSKASQVSYDDSSYLTGERTQFTDASYATDYASLDGDDESPAGELAARLFDMIPVPECAALAAIENAVIATIPTDYRCKPLSQLDFVVPCDEAVSKFTESTAPSIYRIERAQITEHADHFTVHLDMPGVKPKDVQIEEKRGTLQIVAKRASGPDAVYKLSKGLALDKSITDIAKVESKLISGILTLTIPKKTGNKAMNLPIEITDVPIDQDDDNYMYLTLDIPGIKLLGLQVQFLNGHLLVKGRRVDRLGKNVPFWYSYNVRHVLCLDAKKEIDTSLMKAFLVDNILTIMAPYQAAPPGMLCKASSLGLLDTSVDDGNGKKQDASGDTGGKQSATNSASGLFGQLFGSPSEEGVELPMLPMVGSFGSDCLSQAFSSEQEPQDNDTSSTTRDEETAEEEGIELALKASALGESKQKKSGRLAKLWRKPHRN